jgi:lipoate-protein ligase A
MSLRAVHVLPLVRAAGAAQMAVDDGMLRSAEMVMARRYTWAPPALSLGKFQKAAAAPAKPDAAPAQPNGAPAEPAATRRPSLLASQSGLPFDVVYRPSGGRAVLHGEEFEWSFAFVFPAGVLSSPRVEAPYDLVSSAFAQALRELGVGLDGRRTTPYQRSALCFATALRHDLLAGGDKVVAVAQARRAGCALVHGSVLERRPPLELTEAVESLLGEPWRGDGLAASGAALDGDELWLRVVELIDREVAA